jgi:hypothetical protein
MIQKRYVTIAACACASILSATPQTVLADKGGVSFHLVASNDSAGLESWLPRLVQRASIFPTQPILDFPYQPA